VLWDDAQARNTEKIKLKPDAEIRRVVLCTGKVYYDLYEAREAAGISDVYLMRLEQLYPFPAKALVTELSRFPKAEVVWAQEEPRNMGAWSFVEPNIEWVLQHTPIVNTRARYVGRPASAATATGLASRHSLEQKTLVEQALAG
jgi:2-oxoglutarate dehydrogenase E1 component